MASKLTLINAFNTKMDELLNDLIATFPQDKDFKQFKHAVNVLKLMDERKPQAIFHSFAPLYSQHVMARDEAFFLNNDYSEVRMQSDESMDVTGSLVTKLKGYWQDFSAENKEVVWKYLILLFTLDAKIASL